MAKQRKKSGKPAGFAPSEARQGRPAVAPGGARPRGKPQSGDSVSANAGFEEAPQPALEGAPASGGSIEDWVKQLENDAAREQRDAEMRDIRSKAGKHRRRASGQADSVVRTAKTSAAERERAGGDGSVRAGVQEGRKAKSSPKGARMRGELSTGPQGRKGDRPSAPSRGSASSTRDKTYEVGDKRTGGGVSIGGTNDPKERAAAGLNPVAGLDVGLEEAQQLASTSGVTATVEALKALIDAGNPLFKDGKMWVPHRPDRPEKSEGGIPLTMVTDYQPAGDQPVAIKDLVEGLGSLSHLPLDGGGRAEGAGGGDSAMGPPPPPPPPPINNIHKVSN